MNKYIKIVSILLLITLLCGCDFSAKGAVENYLNDYKNLDVDVENDIVDVISKENLNEENSELYKKILEKEYSNLSYIITDEEYNGDEANIKVKISVYDLYKVQEECTEYLKNNPSEFNDENGIYDTNKYLNYKLNKMLEVTDKVDYTIEFYVVKKNNKWVVSSLSNSDLEKLHGIYAYE